MPAYLNFVTIYSTFLTLTKVVAAMQAYEFAVILIKCVGVSRSYPAFFHGLLVHLKIKNNFLIQDVLGGLQPHKPPPRSAPGS